MRQFHTPPSLRDTPSILEGEQVTALHRKGWEILIRNYASPFPSKTTVDRNALQWQSVPKSQNLWHSDLKYLSL